MSKIKDQIIRNFPNLADILHFEKIKKRNLKRLEKLQSMDASDYPDYLKELYKTKTGNQLDLDQPKRFTEKIQWRKIYDQDQAYTSLSDKLAVRGWVEKKIGKEYLIPMLGYWKHFDDVGFDFFPNQFVLKTNNASQTNIVIKDKTEFLKHKRNAKRKMEYWLETPYAFLEGLEFQYLYIDPLIIAEKYIAPDNGKAELVDYKFYCFNGKPILCQVIGDRTTSETIDFYDMKWNYVELRIPPYPNSKFGVKRPMNFELMKTLSSKLSAGFQYVRVDLYESNGKVYFGEMTFTPASGIMKFDPDDWDYILGDLWDINAQQVDHAVVQL